MLVGVLVGVFVGVLVGVRVGVNVGVGVTNDMNSSQPISGVVGLRRSPSKSVVTPAIGMAFPMTGLVD